MGYVTVKGGGGAIANAGQYLKMERTSGTADLLKPWDFAAGRIIVEEAGGFIDTVETEPGHWRVLAGAPGMRDAPRSLLIKC